MNPPIWPPVFAGVCCLVFALVSWVWGQRRRSLALRWGSLGFVAWALNAGFAAASYQFTPRALDSWADLELATLFLGVCLFVVALVYFVLEARPGARMPRQRS
jgi:hypothetical protein